MSDLIFDALFGWILDLLPFDISVARRERLYRDGQRVFFRARVSGLPGSALMSYMAAERGCLWLARRKGAPDDELVPLPLPGEHDEVMISDKATWSEDRYLAYPVRGVTVQIFCKYDWDLLRQAFSDGMAQRLAG
jgi:hypothetical protein